MKLTSLHLILKEMQINYKSNVAFGYKGTNTSVILKQTQFWQLWK